MLLLSLFELAAQSNELLDDYYSRSEADFGTSTYLVLAASGKISESDGVPEALSWLEVNGLDGKFSSMNPDRPVSYGEFAFLLMKGFDLKGGILYSLFPGPRYAAREASYRKWILGNSMPGRTLKPFEAINALTLIAEESQL